MIFRSSGEIYAFPDGEMSERLKEPVLKTGDAKVSVGSNPTLSATIFFRPVQINGFGLEKYPSGRRGSPAKGVGRETVARVQIPPSPPKKSGWNRCKIVSIPA